MLLRTTVRTDLISDPDFHRRLTVSAKFKSEATVRLSEPSLMGQFPGIRWILRPYHRYETYMD
jgi:hypothetical protein